MITDIDYIKAVNSIGISLKKRYKLSQSQVQKILYEINCTVEKELRRLN